MLLISDEPFNRGYDDNMTSEYFTLCVGNVVVICMMDRFRLDCNKKLPHTRNALGNNVLQNMLLT